MIGMKKGLFGKQMQPGAMTPAYSAPQTMAVQDGANLMQQPQARQGFDWKNVLLQTLGGAADGAATFFGGEPVIRQNMQMQQMMAMRQAEEQRRRAADLADYRTKLGIQQEFAGPPEMDAFDRDMIRAGIQPGTPQYDQMAREYAERKVMGQDPLLQGAPIPGGGSFTGPYSRYVELYGGGTAQQPRRPRGTLTPVTGGTAGNGGGSFRP